MKKDAKNKDWHERRAIALEHERDRLILEQAKAGGQNGGQNGNESQKPTSFIGKVKNEAKEIGDLFKVDNSKYESKRSEIQRQIDFERAKSEAEYRKNPGEGPNQAIHRAEIKRLQGELDKNNNEERQHNPYHEAFSTVAPIAASLGGYLAGSKLLSGAKQLAKEGEITAKEVAKLGKKANELLNSRSKGVIAGTVSGDKAKGIVNEAYALGGAKPAFASPGYPGSKETAQQVFSRTGKASGAAYGPPLFNVAAATGAIAASQTDTLAPTPEAKQGERIIAGFEAGVAIGQWASLAKAPGIRPAAAAISAIEGLRARVARETAAGAGKVGKAVVGSAVTRARGAGAIARNQVTARVAGSAVGRDNAVLQAAKAGGELGERRALVRANVQVARNIGSRRMIESGQDVTAARKGMPLSRPDSGTVNRLLANDNRRIQPTPGRYFTRKYSKGPKAGTVEQVRKPSAG